MSLDKAKALKEAGLLWEPDFGDLYWREECNSDMIYCGADPDEDDVWLPRLDQLLRKIEKQGWSWDIQIIKPLPLDPPQVYRCEVWRIGAGNYKQCDANTIEDAIADALIWILTKKKGGLPMGD